MWGTIKRLAALAVALTLAPTSFAALPDGVILDDASTWFSVRSVEEPVDGKATDRGWSLQYGLLFYGEVPAFSAVRTVIARPGKPEVRIDYLLHERDGALRIINVVAQGVSDLALKRAEYGAVIEREGFAVLLEKLQAQTARLAGG